MSSLFRTDLGALRASFIERMVEVSWTIIIRRRMLSFRSSQLCSDSMYHILANVLHLQSKGHL